MYKVETTTNHRDEWEPSGNEGLKNVTFDTSMHAQRAIELYGSSPRSPRSGSWWGWERYYRIVEVPEPTIGNCMVARDAENCGSKHRYPDPWGECTVPASTDKYIVEYYRHGTWHRSESKRMGAEFSTAAEAALALAGTSQSFAYRVRAL